MALVAIGSALVVDPDRITSLYGGENGNAVATVEQGGTATTFASDWPFVDVLRALQGLPPIDAPEVDETDE